MPSWGGHIINAIKPWDQTPKGEATVSQLACRFGA